jgi:hypothetical protein
VRRVHEPVSQHRRELALIVTQRTSNEREFMPAKLLTLDPRAFALVWAAWCIVLAITLLGPGHVMERAPSFRALTFLPVPAPLWGLSMFADGVLLLLALFLEGTWLAPLATYFSVGLWLLVGALTTLSGAMNGFFSPVGGFSLLGALMLILTSAQWGARIH